MPVAIVGRDREVAEILEKTGSLRRRSDLRSDEIKPAGDSVRLLREVLLGVPQEELAGFEDQRQRIQTNQISRIENGGSVKIASLKRLLGACRAVFETRRAHYRNLPTPSWRWEDYVDHAATYEPSVVALHGPAGIGKSSLLRAVAADPRTASVFSDGILTCSLGEVPTAPWQVLQRWAGQLGCDLTDSSAWGDLRTTLAKQLSGRRCLVLVDDAWQAADVHAIAVWGGRSAALITTRSLTVATALAMEADVVEVDGLQREAAVALLRSRLDWHTDTHGVSESEWIELIDAVRGSPLGLRVAAEMISQVEQTRGSAAAVGLLRELLRDVERLLDAAVPAEMAGDRHTRHASTTVQHWIARSTRRDLLDDPLRERFAACACFSGRAEATFDRRAAQAVWQCDDVDAEGTLEQLSRAGLIDARGTGFAMHALYRAHAKRLAREYVANSVILREGAMRHATYYADVARRCATAWVQADAEANGAELEFGGTWPQIQMALSWASENLSTNDEAARLALELARCCEACVSLRLPPRQWLSWAEVGLAAARRCNDPRACERNLRWLAQARARAGEFAAAEDHLHQAMEIAHELADSELLTRGMSMRGAILIETRRFDEAVGELERALSVAQRITDPTTRTRLKAKCYGNLGVAYESLGEFDLALKNQRRQQRAAGKVRDDVLKSYALTNIGCVLIRSGAFAAGIKVLEEQAIPLNRKLGHDPAMAPEYCYLGEGYLRLAEQAAQAGRHEEQVRWQQRSRECYRHALMLAINASDASHARSAIEALGATPKRAIPKGATH